MYFSKKVLDKAACENLGHVAWIEETDPKIAIQQMFASVQSAPVNCAIWAAENLKETTDLRFEIELWRSECHFNFKGKVCEPHTPAEILGSLDSSFAEASKKPSPELDSTPEGLELFEGGLSHLRDFAKRRTKILTDALDPKTIIVRPRVHKTATVKEQPHLHIDRPNPNVGVRFLDSVNGANTYIVSNDLLDDGKFDPKRAQSLLIPIYEVPRNHLVLITQPGHPHQPVMHSESFRTLDREPLERRTTISYDLAF